MIIYVTNPKQTPRQKKRARRKFRQRNPEVVLYTEGEGVYYYVQPENSLLTSILERCKNAIKNIVQK